MSFDANSYGPKALALVSGLLSRCATQQERDALLEKFEKAATILERIHDDTDALLLSMFIGFGAGGQTQGATILPDLFEAMQAGYEGRIHEIAGDQMLGAHPHPGPTDPLLCTKCGAAKMRPAGGVITGCNCPPEEPYP